MSVENGPFGLSTTQTWSISGVPLLKEPAAQLPAASVKPSMMFVFALKERVEWACQRVRRPAEVGPRLADPVGDEHGGEEDRALHAVAVDERLRVFRVEGVAA